MTSGISAHVGGSATELAAEGVSKVAVAGKPDVEGRCRKIVGTALKSFKRSAESQLDQIAMDRDAGLLMKHAGEMKRRRMHGASNVVKPDTLAQAAREPSLGCLSAIRVIGIGVISPAAARQPVPSECGSQYVGDQL